MENLLHSAQSHAKLPDSFVFPADQLPPATTAVVSLPVIDLSGGRDEVRRAVLDAGKELGFFQVVNHGLSDQLVQDTEAVIEEYFQLPAADKAAFYSEDRYKPNRLFSGTTYNTAGEKYWRDCLRLACPFPVGDTKNNWPDKPQRLPEVMEKFIVQTRGVGLEVLRLLCEGIGLRPDYFEGDLTSGDVIINANHYPPCPDPRLTLGLPPHGDRNVITLLHPGAVPGLEVSYKGDWIKVQPVPNALVVNFGHQLEIVTNGMLKSIEHRAMTNSALARTSVAAFIMPAPDYPIGPAEELLGEDNPPRYGTLTFREFMLTYNTVILSSAVNLTTNIKSIHKVEEHNGQKDMKAIKV